MSYLRNKIRLICIRCIYKMATHGSAKISYWIQFSWQHLFLSFRKAKNRIPIHIHGIVISLCGWQLTSRLTSSQAMKQRIFLLFAKLHRRTFTIKQCTQIDVFVLTAPLDSKYMYSEIFQWILPCDRLMERKKKKKTSKQFLLEKTIGCRMWHTINPTCLWNH